MIKAAPAMITMTTNAATVITQNAVRFDSYNNYNSLNTSCSHIHVVLVALLMLL